jgi:hypothetical protein
MLSPHGRLHPDAVEPRQEWRIAALGYCPGSRATSRFERRDLLAWVLISSC